MYYQYFGLTEAPFSIAVNPRYLFMSPRHRDALAHLLYGVGAGGGFILLTGEVGTGKTTINRCLLEQLPDNTDVAIILNPALNAMELLASVCDELGISYDHDQHTLKTLTDSLHRFLLDNHQRGRKTVLLIDEAQHLDFEVLEQIRLLTNLETNSEKLLQIILIGQPELARMLARPELRQLNQRITARYNLEPLDLEETGAYIRHRLQVAGMSAGHDIFPSAVVRGIHRYTRGVPRLINVLCDRILLGAYGRNQERANQAMLHQAAREVMGDETAGGRGGTSGRTWLLAAGGLLLVVVAIWWLLAGDEWPGPIPGASRPAQTEPVGGVAARSSVGGAGTSAVGQEPSAMDQQPSATDQQPSATDQQPPSPDRQPAATDQQLAAASHQLPAVDQQPAIVAQSPSADNPQPLAGQGEHATALDNAPPGAQRRAPAAGLEGPAGVGQPPSAAGSTLPSAGPATASAAPPIQTLPWLLPTGDAMAQLWGLYSPEPRPDNPCDGKMHASLACVEKSAATWDELADFNRPLLLEMITPQRFTASVLYLGSTGRSAWVASDRGVEPVGLAELGPLWTGKYSFLWHPPKGFHRLLRLGDKSAVVARVAALFARLDGQDQPLTGPRFNEALEQRVRLFQREHGIADDGVVGMQTLLKLNEALGIDLSAGRARRILQANEADGETG